MLSSIGRAAIRRVVAAQGHTSTNKTLTTKSWQACAPSNVQTSFGRLALSLQRLYATAAKPAKKTAATKKKPASKTTQKPKSKLKRAPKKTTKKAAPVKKKKVVKKAAKKPKKKVVVKKTPEQLQRLKIKTLKITALEEPVKKPTNAWMVFIANQATQYKAINKENGAKFKALSPSELEQLNHTAAQNKVANNIAYKEFIRSHTPDEIRLANNARVLLKRLPGKYAKPKLVDDRLPLQPRTAFLLFSKERWASGDFKNITLAEAAKIISKEYKELSDSARKPYDDDAAADHLRYTQEFKTVFNRDPDMVKKAAV